MAIIYDESAETYHASPAIGSTDIRAFIRSPMLFNDMQRGLVEKETPALMFGTASHVKLLEPGRFAQMFAVKPEGMNFGSAEGKAWKARHPDYVTAAESRSLVAMLERMPAEVARIFGECQKEVTVRTEITGAIGSLPVQCRFDLFSRNALYDLKTICAIESVETSIHKYGYHIQQRWYQSVYAQETGEKAPSFRFIFAEKSPPHRWRIVELDWDYCALADAAINEAVAGILARRKSGCWSDPEDLHLIASPPPWLHDPLAFADVGADKEE